MKEFEKWVEEDSLKVYGDDTYAASEEGWQAALIWILTWETDGESIEIIEKELNDE